MQRGDERYFVDDYAAQGRDDDNQPHWFCESCGYKNTTKPMPPDRAKFYARVTKLGSPKCPRCKSETFMPVGY